MVPKISGVNYERRDLEDFFLKSRIRSSLLFLYAHIGFLKYNTKFAKMQTRVFTALICQKRGRLTFRQTPIYIGGENKNEDINMKKF